MRKLRSQAEPSPFRRLYPAKEVRLLQPTGRAASGLPRRRERGRAPTAAWQTRRADGECRKKPSAVPCRLHMGACMHVGLARFHRSAAR